MLVGGQVRQGRKSAVQRMQEPSCQRIGVDRDSRRKRLGLLGGGFGQEFGI